MRGGVAGRSPVPERDRRDGDGRNIKGRGGVKYRARHTKYVTHTHTHT